MASLYLRLDYMFPQPDEAAKTIRLALSTSSLRAHQPVKQKYLLPGPGQTPWALSARVPGVSLIPSAQKSTLWARRNQVLHSSALQNRHSAQVSLRCGRYVFFGCCFVDQKYLMLTWSQSKHPLPSLQLPAGSGEAWSQILLERSKMGLTHGIALGWLWRSLGSSSSTSCWVSSVPVQEGLREIQRQHRSWIDYLSGTPESCVLSASPPAPDSTPWSGHFILRRL